ncbi:unnamed protein product [Cuscuta epithymum]|uniref:Uncharacterized protein n=1 Tax=Cuscuta epithymum TaxID=186058 RepID=A0AAV0CDZ6_9ASTE|nr:unnamed protein product [Cuscuta epithymum]
MMKMEVLDTIVHRLLVDNGSSLFSNLSQIELQYGKYSVP